MFNIVVCLVGFLRFQSAMIITDYLLLGFDYCG